MCWGFRYGLVAKHKAWEPSAKAFLGDREIAVGDYFGRPSFASLVGIMTLFRSAGALISVAVSGSIFYQTRTNLVSVIVYPMLQFSEAALALARRALPPVSLSV